MTNINNSKILFTILIYLRSLEKHMSDMDSKREKFINQKESKKLDFNK